MTIRRNARTPLITLLTDFGLEDIYVGVIKGVIASMAPQARIIDITHGVAPHDVVQGGLRWAAAVPFFPSGSIHVAVVDPGVGGPRPILAARARGSIFLAPDNGLLGFVASPEEVEEEVVVEDRNYFLPKPSSTFHGRDIFAPVAAHLSLGLPLKKLGPAAAEMVRIDLPRPRQVTSGGTILIQGEIVDIDNFGNCITNIPAGPETKKIRDIRVGKWRFPEPEKFYGARQSGQPLVVAGSMGYLEIAVNRGRADRILSLRRGQRVTARAIGKE